MRSNIYYIIIGYVIGMLLATIIASMNTKDREEIIERGYGQYSPTTGNFEWLSQKEVYDKYNAALFIEGIKDRKLK